MSFENNNLAIYSAYCPDFELCEGDFYILKELKDNSSNLIVVINGNISEKCKNRISLISDEIIFRDNKGFDAGAYKYILFNFINEDIDKYDNLILCNNTFLGFFVPLQNILSKMHDTKSDVWGLNFVQGNLWPHIESYFLVFSRKVLASGDLFQFFALYDENTIDRIKAVITFENEVYSFFLRSGWSLGTYTCTNNTSIYRSEETVIKYGLPIIKKKSLCNVGILGYVDEIKRSIKDMGSFDISIIDEYISRGYSKKELPENIEKVVEIPEIHREELDAIFEKSDSLYLYGTGVIAKKVYFMFEEYKNKIQGFVVSDDRIPIGLFDVPCFTMSQIMNDLPIIICLNKKNSKEVYYDLCNRKNVVWLWKF